MLRRLQAALTAFSDPSVVTARKTTGEELSDLKNRVGLLEGKSSNGSGDSLESALSKLEGWKKHPSRWDRIQKITDEALRQAGVSSGVMLEIGGRLNPRKENFPSFQYFALDLEEQKESSVSIAVGDITSCPNIPDNSYDFIFSIDVFEHINRPWLAGAEITRILKPGGVTVHSTLFAWRYHPCPEDYFRYTPEGMSVLFPDLECVHKSFDYTERRRNMLGRGNNKLKPDILGGWRENVRVNYAGIKRV